MKKTLLALPLIAGAIVLAGCGGGSSDQSTQANAAEQALKDSLKSATTGAAPVRRASAAIGPAALQVVNKTNQTVQLHVGGVDNYDWANGNRPDHIPAQGVNKAVLAPGWSTLAPRFDVNEYANGSPFNVHFISSKRGEPELGHIRLDVCRIGGISAAEQDGGDTRRGELITAPEVVCKEDWRTRSSGRRDYPQAGDFIIRVDTPAPIPTGNSEDPTNPPDAPTIVTITSKSNPTW